MTGERIIWLTRGRRAGTFGTFAAGQAQAIIEAGMGQDVKGQSAHQLARFTVTDEDYPAGDATPPAKPATPKDSGATKTREVRAGPGKGEPVRGRHKRRDMRPEE